MTRRNRRKLHQELRLRAETLRAQRTEIRRRRLAERQRAERAVADALRARATRARRIDALPPAIVEVERTISTLLELAAIPAATRRKVVRLFRLVAVQIPAHARCTDLPWLLLLARQPWVREPEWFRAPSGSTARKRDALAQQLLVRYDVPPFLLRALDVEPEGIARVAIEDEWAVALLARLGRGEPSRDLSSCLPTPLTRRMVHLFLDAVAGTAPIEALRVAQVVGHGGPAELGRALVRTRLGALASDDLELGEPFWDRVIGWVCRQPELHRARVDALDTLLAYLHAEQQRAIARGLSLVLRGRGGARTLERATAWKASQRAPREALPSSGLEPWSSGSLAVVELDTPRALQEEGEAMRNCAACYVGLVRRRKASLFSLRSGGERRVTIEVAAGAVVQVKRRANAEPTADDLAVITRWALDRRLRIRLSR